MNSAPLRVFAPALLILLILLAGCTLPQITPVVRCGNEECEADENAENCPEDCGVCTDSDGVNYYVSSSATDSCAGSILTEGFCYQNQMRGANYDCPGMCRDGACVCDNTTVTFRTNAMNGNYGEDTWIALDRDGDNALEGYGWIGPTGCHYYDASQHSILTKTPEGYYAMSHNPIGGATQDISILYTTEPPIEGICYQGSLYRNTYTDAANAMLYTVPYGPYTTTDRETCFDGTDYFSCSALPCQALGDFCVYLDPAHPEDPSKNGILEVGKRECNPEAGNEELYGCALVYGTSGPKETYFEGDVILGINGPGGEVILKLLQVTMAGAEYPTTFELYDHQGVLLDTQNAREGDYLNNVFGGLDTPLYVDRIAIAATTGVGFVDIIRVAEKPQFQLLGNCAACDGTCANGACTIPHCRDLAKYSPKEVFLISDSDWQSVLELVPVAIWDDAAVQHKYPLLIYHREGSAFDADSIIHFLQQYSPTRVTLVGSYPEQLYGLLLAAPPLGAELSPENLQAIPREDILRYWGSFDTVVYVNDDYGDALLASTYASLKNAPLIIQDSQFDTEMFLGGMDALCVGPSAWNPPAYVQCTELYTAKQLQEHYVALTNTDKVLFMNPNDINPEFGISDSITPEKSQTPISELYTKNSLAAPYLAAARHEVLVSNFAYAPEPDPYMVAEDLHSAIGRLMPSLLLQPGGITSMGRETYNLYLYNLSTGESEVLFKSSRMLSKPRIHGNNIVFSRSNSFTRQTVYHYDTAAGQMDTVWDSLAPLTGLGVHGDRAAALANDYLFLRLADLATGNKNTIDSDYGGMRGQSAIYGDIVVWEDYRNGNWDIYMYDLSTNQETQITSDTMYQSEPAIYGDKIVWTDTRHGNYDIYMYDLSTNEETQITANIANQQEPAIYGNKIVWMDTRSGFFDIYMHDLATETETQITASTNSQMYPAIHGDRITWKENTPSPAICIKEGQGSPTCPIPISDFWHVNYDFYGDYIVWVDTTQETDYLNGYLTVMGAQKAVPAIDVMRGLGPLDQLLYGDIAGSDGWPEMFTGRIAGLTASDVSAYVARDLFYDDLGKTDSVVFMASSHAIMTDQATPWSAAFQNAGYQTDLHATATAYYQFDPALWEGRDLVSYLDHGGPCGSGIGSGEIPELSNSVVSSFSCSTCAGQGIYVCSFCMRALRRGALVYLGAAAIDSGNNKTYMNVKNGIYYDDLTTGEAFAKYVDAYFPTTFIGDPALDVQPLHTLSQPLEWGDWS